MKNLFLFKVYLILIFFTLIPAMFAQNFPLLYQDSSFQGKHPIGMVIYEQGKYIFCSIKLAKGYGIQRGKKNSFVTFFRMNSNGRKEKIKNLPFKGKIAKEDNHYFSKVFPVGILKRKMGRNKKVFAKVRLLYCHFQKGICYQMEKEKSLDY